MATPAHGKIEEFQPQSEPFTAYIERVKLYFAANDIRNAKQVPVFLSVLGAKNYALLRNLLSPVLPQDKSLDELVATLQAHFDPKPVVIAERFYFHRRNQAVGESIAEYIAELRRLTTHCDYGTHLENALRDRLVCGLRSETMQKRLLAEADLTLTKAQKLAQGMEAAERNAKALKEPAAAVQQVLQRTPAASAAAQCYRCGRPNHLPSECRFRDAECHHCKKKGHIATVCRNRLSGRAPGQGSQSGRNAKNRRAPHQRAKWLGADEASQDETETEELNMFAIGERAASPIQVGLLVNGKRLDMELDTGAAVSIMSEKQKMALFPDASLEKSPVRLKTYTGHPLQVQGELKVTVQYGEQVEDLVLIIVSGDGPALMGRSWLQRLRLDWKGICAIATEKSAKRLEALLAKYENLFADDLGTIEPFKAKLHVKSDAQPKFWKPRPVPFAIKDTIEKELDRLEECGILEKVTYSEWAAPIVAVPKKDVEFVGTIKSL